MTSLSPVQPPVRVPVCQQESLGRHCVRALCVIIVCVLTEVVLYYDGLSKERAYFGKLTRDTTSGAQRVFFGLPDIENGKESSFARFPAALPARGKYWD